MSVAESALMPVAPRVRIGSRLRGWRPDALAVTAGALMANTVVTSVLGMAFWAVASRTYSARQLGESAALISAMMLLSVISQLNLAMGISRLLPQVRERRWRPVTAAYAVAAGVGLVVTAAFATLAPRLSGSFSFLGRDVLLGLALVVAVILWNVFALQDAVLTAARWAVAVPVENGLFGILKIGLMVWLAHGVAGQGIFVAWVVAMAVMLVPVNGLVFGKVLPGAPLSTGPEDVETVLPLGDRARITRYLAVDYVAALLNQGYTSLLPLLVVAVLGRDANAYFYISFVIAGAVRAVAQSMSTSLIVEGAHDETRLASLTRLTVVRYAKYAVPGIAALVVAAPLLLHPFGAAYVDRGTTVLRLLLVATVPQAVVALYLGVERVRARVSRVLAIEAATVVLVTVGAVLGMRWSGLVARAVPRRRVRHRRRDRDRRPDGHGHAASGRAHRRPARTGVRDVRPGVGVPRLGPGRRRHLAGRAGRRRQPDRLHRGRPEPAVAGAVEPARTALHRRAAEPGGARRPRRDRGDHHPRLGRPMTTGTRPVWVAEVELDRSLLPEGVARARRVDDAAARILVRAGHEVLGFVTLAATGGDVSTWAVSAAISRQLSEPLARREAAVAPAADSQDERMTVVVSTRDRPEMLAVCLERLQKLEYPAYEVVVVDNAPASDQSRRCFDRVVGEDSRFRYVLEPRPGLSRARNRGMAEARTRHVAFTDDDVQVDPWWLHGIAAGFRRAPGAGCVTGLVAPAALDHPAQQYFDRRFAWSSRLDRQVYRLTGHAAPSTLYPYSAGLFGTGANFAVDRELIVDLGGFDEALGAGSPAGGGEELDVFVRVLRAERALVYEPSAVVWHVHRRDERASRRQLFYYGVGLTAFLSKYLLDASTSGEILARVPSGARKMWRMWSASTLGAPPPPSLVLAEAAGMVVGPFAYLWGRHRLARRPVE